jgi:hypothetical protein
MSVKEIRQLRTQIMMTALTLGIRNNQTLVKAVDSIPSRALWQTESPRVLKPDLVQNYFAKS